jgi:hypothetical protein
MTTSDSPCRSKRMSSSGEPRRMATVALARFPKPSTATRSSREAAVVVLT